MIKGLRYLLPRLPYACQLASCNDLIMLNLKKNSSGRLFRITYSSWLSDISVDQTLNISKRRNPSHRLHFTQLEARAFGDTLLMILEE